MPRRKQYAGGSTGLAWLADHPDKLAPAMDLLVMVLLAVEEAENAKVKLTEIDQDVLQARASGTGDLMAHLYRKLLAMKQKGDVSTEVPYSFLERWIRQLHPDDYIVGSPNWLSTLMWAWNAINTLDVNLNEEVQAALTATRRQTKQKGGSPQPDHSTGKFKGKDFGDNRRENASVRKGNPDLFTGKEYQSWFATVADQNAMPARLPPRESEVDFSDTRVAAEMDTWLATYNPYRRRSYGIEKSWYEKLSEKEREKLDASGMMNWNRFDEDPSQIDKLLNLKKSAIKERFLARQEEESRREGTSIAARRFPRDSEVRITQKDFEEQPSPESYARQEAMRHVAMQSGLLQSTYNAAATLAGWIWAVPQAIGSTSAWLYNSAASYISGMYTFAGMGAPMVSVLTTATIAAILAVTVAGGYVVVNRARWNAMSPSEKVQSLRPKARYSSNEARRIWSVFTRLFEQRLAAARAAGNKVLKQARKTQSWSDWAKSWVWSPQAAGGHGGWVKRCQGKTTSHKQCKRAVGDAGRRYCWQHRH